MQQPIRNEPHAPEKTPFRVVLVEDDEYYARVVRKHILRTDPATEVIWVDKLATACELLEHESPDVVLLDLCLPDAAELEGFYSLRKVAPDIPVVVLSNNQNSELALEAVRNGAQDFLLKEGISGESIARAARYAVERMKAEQSQLRLEAINDFMAMMTHDLKIPLLATERALQLIRSELGLTEKQKESLLDGIATEHSSLIGIVNRLIEVYRYETEVSPFRRQQCQLDSLITEALKPFRQVAGKTPNFVMDYTDNPGIVHGDRGFLERMFSNIFDNVIRHCQPDVIVRISARKSNGFWEISIADNGPGIPKEVQRHLFARVWHGVAGRRYATGSGFGLYLSYRIALRHGGKIAVSDNPTGGAVVTVYLPVVG